MKAICDRPVIYNSMSTFAISDLHFGDDCVRQEFDRPFKDVEDMKDFLVARWNTAVSEADRVLFVGDVNGNDKFDSVKRVRNQIQYHFEELNGKIALIPGNHDQIGHPNKAAFEVAEEPEFDLKGINFRCQHRPPTSQGEQWVIHGHMHTNKNDQYPFINPEKKTINVSAELLHYTPISMERLVELIQSGIKYPFCPPSALGQ